jgi:hypothetical protein
MGYHMSQREASFFIPAEKQADALAALKKMVAGQRLGFVFAEDVIDAPTLSDAMEAFRWPVETDELGNIVGLEFAGAKLGDGEILFKIIAPFVWEGSYIEMGGDENAIWRWTFQNGEMKEVAPKITW